MRGYSAGRTSSAGTDRTYRPSPQSCSTEYVTDARQDPSSGRRTQPCCMASTHRPSCSTSTLRGGSIRLSSSATPATVGPAGREQDEFERLTAAGVNRFAALTLVEEIAARRVPRARWRYPREHGTERGYRQHQQTYRDPACRPCLDAHADYTHEHCMRST